MPALGGSAPVSLRSSPPLLQDGFDDTAPFPDRIPAEFAGSLPLPPHSGYYNTMTPPQYTNGESHDLSSAVELGPLQENGILDGADLLEPVGGDDPASYDLVAPAPVERREYSLEKQSQALFSKEHLQVIFADPTMLLRFTAFLSANRPQSVQMLIYYLDALKALRAINYANAICEALDPIEGHVFTSQPVGLTANALLEQKANDALEALAREDLPAYITQQYIQVVSVSISQRISGTLPPHLREASEGLAEVFCLTDPSRPDNPIVFASEEFHRTTQYGMTYVLGRNCRFLQGPHTSPLSVRRLREAIAAGRQHQEVFLNYRRDGSPFMNLLMCAPLCDSRGQIRYFIGAQVDVSGLVRDCTEMESLQRLLEAQKSEDEAAENDKPSMEKKDEFQELSKMLNSSELATVRKYGGRMHHELQDDEDATSMMSHRPRLLLKEPSSNGIQAFGAANGKLSGIYQHYLLVRPYPSLRILFASPSQRIPGILQSPFLNKIGGSGRVREELIAALADGRGVTAKVRWISKADENGRNRWIHCTPLVGVNGQIGVWMIVIVDDEKSTISSSSSSNRKWRPAPPVAQVPTTTPTRERVGRPRGMINGEEVLSRATGNLRSGNVHPTTNGYHHHLNYYYHHHDDSSSRAASSLGSGRSSSPTSLNIK